ncbi:MAG: hypothetical protein ACAI35_06615 [Candidatus Methylacidiphilales bacterium]|nr:hypothetical protein [Candidatus Methylacidiphilales bacterium]
MLYFREVPILPVDSKTSPLIPTLLTVNAGIPKKAASYLLIRIFLFKQASGVMIRFFATNPCHIVTNAANERTFFVFPKKIVYPVHPAATLSLSSSIAYEFTQEKASEAQCQS